jgi:hypothetical protein
MHVHGALPTRYDLLIQEVSWPYVAFERLSLFKIVPTKAQPNLKKVAKYHNAAIKIYVDFAAQRV